MTATITLESKQLGTQKPLFPARQILYPLDFQTSGGQTTLRELIRRIVLAELADLEQQSVERDPSGILTVTQIAEGVARGSITFDRSGGQDVTHQREDAVTAALTAFQRKAYLVFVDGKPLKDLDAPLQVLPDSKVTFVRLVPLVGG